MHILYYSNNSSKLCIIACKYTVAEKTLANLENNFLNLTSHTLQMLTKQPKKKKRAANRKKHLQIKKTLSSIWQHTRCKCSQHNQKKETHCK